MIEILTSGVALGVHVPGLLLAERLRERGVPAGVSVLERLLPPEKLATTARMKWAFHRDFRLSLAGMRSASGPARFADDAELARLLARWSRRGVDHFAVWSGFWLPIVARYADTCAVAPRVDLCHIDSMRSPSFTRTADTGLSTRDVWMMNGELGGLPCSVPVSNEAPVPWRERARRLHVHGGGWGMGDYQDHVGGLAAAGFALDVLAYEQADLVDIPGVRYFMLDPRWHPWLDDGFPPLGEVRDGEPGRYRRGTGHPASFDLTRAAMATVSKPGGGTLLDSLWSATPTVLLEPWGRHEAGNAALWRRLGFGIGIEDWRRTGCDPAVLERLHHNLLRASADVPDYARSLATRSPAGEPVR